MLDLRADNKFAFILTVSTNIESQMEVCQQSTAKLKKKILSQGISTTFVGVGVCSFESL